MRRRKAVGLLLLFILTAHSIPAFPTQQTHKVIAIVGAMVIDGTGAEPFPATVLIRGERIAAVGADVAIPAGARIIHAEGQTLIPGIFDMHTHLPYATVRGANSDWAKNLKSYLYCGVTSVVDFGTYGETFAPMRQLIKSGAVLAPRLHLAARMGTPGGHGSEGGRGDLFTLEVQTPREVRAAVQRVLPYKPDVIKVFTDGWRYGAASDMTSMNEETLTAIVEEAHRNGIEVLTHTVTLEKAKIAVRAGVDVLAHGVGNAEIDAELINLMKTKGTTYVSTLAVYEPRGRVELTPLLDAVLSTDAKEALKSAPANPPAPPSTGNRNAGISPAEWRWKNLLHNIAALRAAGLRIGTGTDAGIVGTHHGWATLREIELLVQGGLTPLEAITAATGNSAKALRVDNERGFIKEGMLADMVLIEGAPYKRIGDIERISRVFLGGRELDRKQIASDIAQPGITPLAANKVSEKLDDFERGDNRSSIDTLWVNAFDAGHDHTKMVWGRTLRSGTNHVLSVLSRMSDVERPYARVSLPLSRGAVVPVDASGFRGIQFEARGDGEYSLLIPTYRALNFSAKFRADTVWKTIKIDFATLKAQTSQWTGTDLLMLTFEIARKPDELGWLELDGLQFYK